MGGWRREFGAVPIYAVNPVWLSPPVPLQANSGVWPHQGQTQAGSSVFQKPCPFPTGGKGLPGRVEMEHLPLCCINCCLGPHDVLPLDFCQGDPGPEIPPPPPLQPRTPGGEMVLSTDASLRPRSCFTFCDPTLHSCLPRRTLSAFPQEEIPEGTIASWWWNEVVHCPGLGSGQPGTSENRTTSPPPRTPASSMQQETRDLTKVAPPTGPSESLPSRMEQKAMMF